MIDEGAARREAAILAACRPGLGAADPAHDEGHLHRVLAMARRIAAQEEPHDPVALTAAALLHGLEAPPKDSPLRPGASRLSARRALGLLRGLGFPEAPLPGVAHAIEAHGIPAGVEPAAPGARALRDADRLDALGAVGVARCFAAGGALGRALADTDDPWPSAACSTMAAGAWTASGRSPCACRRACGRPQGAGSRGRGRPSCSPPCGAWPRNAGPRLRTAGVHPRLRTSRYETPRHRKGPRPPRRPRRRLPRAQPRAVRGPPCRDRDFQWRGFSGGTGP